MEKVTHLACRLDAIASAITCLLVIGHWSLVNGQWSFNFLIKKLLTSPKTSAKIITHGLERWLSGRKRQIANLLRDYIPSRVQSLPLRFYG